ncbi:MAG: M23 family metallopeptidase [Saprospiraceae bacterium]|nr:M23 family metallopeptidase [Saprospiraceae bacterium]
MHRFFRILFCGSLICITLFSCDEDFTTLTEEGDGTSDLGCTPNPDPEYILPFTPGSSFTLLQGNCSSFNHLNDLRYAYDFAMPIGTPVIAARNGIVNFIEEGFTDNDHQIDHVNVVTIDHIDGTFARYQHLTHNGVLVDLGSVVSTGDTIALSGFTGFAEEPILHFDVSKCIGDCSSSETQSISFENANPAVVDQEEVRYLAEPFN